MIDEFWVFILYALTFVTIFGIYFWYTSIKYRGHFYGKNISAWRQIKAFKDENPRDGRVIQILLLLMQIITFFAIVYIAFGER